MFNHIICFCFILKASLAILRKAKVQEYHGMSISRMTQTNPMLFADDDWLFFRASLMECNYILQLLQIYEEVSSKN